MKPQKRAAVNTGARTSSPPVLRICHRAGPSYHRYGREVPADQRPGNGGVLAEGCGCGALVVGLGIALLLFGVLAAIYPLPFGDGGSCGVDPVWRTGCLRRS